MLKTSITGVRDLYKAMGAQTRAQKRALDVAIKVEGFRQLRLLRDEVRAGDPGGRPYLAKLSKLAGRTKTGRLRKNQVPLYRLARLLRFDAIYKNGDLQFTFGFVKKRNPELTGSYKELLIKHQEGVDVLYRGSRTELGKRFARIGGKLKKQGDPDARYFFLRKTTGRKLDIPKRPIIIPFWAERRTEAGRNIALNFRRKLRGERI